MRHIIKNPEPQAFADWKSAHPGANYKDNLCHDGDLDAFAAKSALKKELLKEQRFLCCYCECCIEATTSHIEHFKPKGVAAYSYLQLDYGNLHASCGFRPLGTIEEHCGHKKSNDFSANLISPLEPDCALHFTYTMDGKIGFTDHRGEETIKMLKLDSSLLVRQRKRLIDYFFSLDPNDIDAELDEHLDATKDHLGEFFTTIDFLRQHN